MGIQQCFSNQHDNVGNQGLRPYCNTSCHESESSGDIPFQAVSLECSSDQEAFALFEHLFMGGVFGTNLFDYPLGQSINILMFTIALLFSCTTESLNLWMKQIKTYQETTRTAYIHRKLTGIHQDMIYDPLTLMSRTRTCSVAKERVGNATSYTPTGDILWLLLPKVTRVRRLGFMFPGDY